MKATEALVAVFSQMQKIKERKELDKYILLLVGTSIAMLRGSKGHKFTEDFLQAAINDEEPPVITAHELQ